MFGSLQQTIEYRHKRLIEFATAHPDVWELIESFVISARAMIMECASYLDNPIRYTTAHMMWHNVYEYQEDSLFLLILGRIDAGYALLRMAAELSRDASRVWKDDAKHDMWQKRDEIRREGYYKDVFRFNDEDATERYVHGIYTLASNYGIHGHQSSQMSMSSRDRTADGQYVIMQIDYLDVLSSLKVWLFSFFPLQTLASRGFQDRLGQDKSPAYQAFLEIQVASGDALSAFTNAVKRLRDGVTNNGLEPIQ